MTTVDQDLRYPARRNKAKLEAEAVQRFIAEEVDKANDFLKSQNCKPKLFKTGNSIQLTATLPVKPGDTPSSAKGTKQYRITHLQCYANLEGVQKAIAEAIRLDQLLKSDRFSWEAYLPEEKSKELVPQTWGDVILQFEQHYWVTHSQTRKSLNTWDKSYADLFKKLDLKAKISNNSILDAIKRTEANTVTRNHLIRVLKALCKFIDYKYDFKPYVCPLKRLQRRERVIPTDAEIIKAYNSMPDDTKWTFGMIATYGLRPEEIFINPHFNEFCNPANTMSIFHVDKDCKTGDRKVLPLKPEWVELFDLKNCKPLTTNAKKLETIISWVNKKFQKSPDWKCGAYNLRHGYAIRGHKYGIPVADMARYMGHDIETHVSEYQRWIGIDTMIEVYLEATNAQQKSRKTLVTENAVLLADSEKLKAENEQLKRKISELELEIRLIREIDCKV